MKLRNGRVTGKLESPYFEGLSNEGHTSGEFDCEECGETKTKGQFCSVYYCQASDECWEEEAIFCSECLEKYGIS